MWAREDSAGLLVQALITLARDDDAEVVRALDIEWVKKHRKNPVPDVLAYVRTHALPNSASRVEQEGTQDNTLAEVLPVESEAVEELTTEFVRLVNVTSAPEEAVEKEEVQPAE